MMMMMMKMMDDDDDEEEEEDDDDDEEGAREDGFCSPRVLYYSFVLRVTGWQRFISSSGTF